MRFFFTLWILFLSCGQIVAQNGYNLLNNYETSLVKIIEKDSGDFFATIDNNEFKFGTDFKGATFINIAKNKGTLYLHPLGTGRLYQIVKENNQYYSKRLDSTLHSGVNFFSKSFFIRDTLYQYGGLGFWTIRGIMTFFSKQTNQWELVQTNQAVPSFFDNNQDAVVQVSNNPKNPKLYVSNSYLYEKYPQSFEIIGKDTCFEFDFNNKKWSALGKLNPNLKRILQGKNTLAFDIGKYLLVQTALEFYWINFEENSYGKIKTKYSTEIRQIWLSLYNNETKKGLADFQFNIGDNIYFFKLNNKKELEVKAYKFDPEMLDLSEKSYIYSNKTDYLNIIVLYINTNKVSIFLFIIILLSLLLIVLIQKRKKKIPKEVVAILNNNFFNALTIVEKELIEELYKHHLRGEDLSTKLINKIIGVQQKDTLTQNKSRSDYFIRINQKFRIATQHTDSLIIKHRDSIDKRQYNYSLNPDFIEDIVHLLKN